MVKTRKSLWAAGFALLVCILLLIGTTFAWFTDSVSNRGNKIQAGNLSIVSFAAYDSARVDTLQWAKNRYSITISAGKPGYTEVAGKESASSRCSRLKYKLEYRYGEPGKTCEAIDGRNDGSVAARGKSRTLIRTTKGCGRPME